MDNDFLNKGYAEKPIVLSPPPVNGPTSNSYDMSGLPSTFHSQRNQSLGHNLQQEFETLKADLDLDLSLANDTPASSYRLGCSAQDDSRLISLRSDSSRGTVSAPTSAVDHSVGGTGAVHSLQSRPGLMPRLTYLMNLMLETLVRDGVQLGKLGSSFLPQLSAPARPQSVNEFKHSLGGLHSGKLQLHQNGLVSDMIQTTSWIESLSTHEIVTVINFWCNNLPFDVLLTMKHKLESHLGSQVSHGLPHVFGSASQFGQDYKTPDFGAESRLSSVHLGNVPSSIGSPNSCNSGNAVSSVVEGNDLSQNQGGLLQPKPKANGSYRSHFFKSKLQRPKLADPTVNGRFTQNGAVVGPPVNGHSGYPNQVFTSSNIRNPTLGQLAVDRARSPTMHLCEKTNFLQLAAGQSPHSFGPSNEDSLDLSEALKLGALATINSRVVLDSGRKNYSQASAAQRGAAIATASFEESLNRQTHSSSASVGVQKYSTVAQMGRSKEGDSPGKIASGGTLGDASSTGSGVTSHFPNSAISSLNTTAAPAGTSMPNEIAGVELLNNIPAWLKLLRLHKYTDCLKDIYWKDLVSLLDLQLEECGVRALGARRKLLKAFEAVKQART